MTRRSSPSFAIGIVKPEFKCLICGAETATYPVDAVRGVCEQHCYDHDYQHDGWRGHCCVHCGAEPPDDWYHSDDDVGFGFSPIAAGEPVGVHASAMNGNAADRHNDPDGWARWVAFCERCGHP